MNEDEVTLEGVCEAMRELAKQVEALSDRIYDLTERVDAGMKEEHIHHHYGQPPTWQTPPPPDWRAW